ncbi:MAG: hypothetical protein ACRD2N_23455 [Vicinamibacterales bacterium]
MTKRWLYVGAPFGAVAITMAALAILEWRSRGVVVETGLLIDGVTFDISELDAKQLGGRVTDEERAMMRRVVWEQVQTAYAGLRLRFTENPNAFYKVRLVQGTLVASSKMSSGASGETYSLGPLGGISQVSVTIAVRGAFAYAPDGATRRDILEAIGRGVGRTIVHELGHQILGSRHPHSTDVRSYEYGSPDRIGQYYGPIHWSIWQEPLRDVLGK